MTAPGGWFTDLLDGPDSTGTPDQDTSSWLFAQPAVSTAVARRPMAFQARGVPASVRQLLPGATPVRATPVDKAQAEAEAGVKRGENIRDVARAVKMGLELPLYSNPVTTLAMGATKAATGDYQGAALDAGFAALPFAGKAIAASGLPEAAGRALTTAVGSEAGRLGAEPSVGKLVKALQTEGGATLHPDGKPFGGSAYMVADPAFTVAVKSAKEMRAFLGRADVKEALGQGKLIGKWTDPETGITEINLSDPLGDAKAAQKLAAQRGEQSAGHIAEGAYQGDVQNPHAPVRAVQAMLEGMRTQPQMRRITEIPATHGHQLAQAYDALPKNDPAAKSAYDALNREVQRQYDAITGAGYKVDFTDADPYKNSAEMIKDVRDHKTLKVFKTPSDNFHPYMTPEQNDRFRAVHDFLAHAGGGNQFGAVGEENAYRVHASTLSPEAQQALAAETRGQNSYVNFGPNSHLPVKDRPFAEQKAALFPTELLGDYNTLGPGTWSPDQLETYGQKYGVPGLGRVSPRHEVTLTNGQKVNIPGGVDGTFSYHDLLQLKAEGINPNLLPEGLHDQVHAKIMRTMTPADISDEDMFRMLSFGLTSPNSPLTPNEFTVSRLMPRSMEDIKKLARANPKTLPHELGVDAASKGGLGTSGSVDYATVVKLAQLFEKNPKWFRRAADEPWDQYVDRLATQIPGLGTKTASLGAVWQDLPNAAVSAVDRHMTELAMPHILQHPELGPDFRARAVKSWNGQPADVLAEKGGPVKSLEELRQRDPIYARDFLASLINDPHQFNFRTSKGEFGQNVPESMRKTDFIEEPEKATLMNPYYREALKYNAGQQGAGESLFGSQWRLWDRQRGRIEPHEVMYPGLNKLPRMDLQDAKAALQAHKDANYTRSGNAARLLPKAEGAAAHMPAVKRLLNPMSLGYWGLGGLAVGAAASEQR